MLRHNLALRKYGSVRCKRVEFQSGINPTRNALTANHKPGFSKENDRKEIWQNKEEFCSDEI